MEPSWTREYISRCYIHLIHVVQSGPNVIFSKSELCSSFSDVSSLTTILALYTYKRVEWQGGREYGLS